jgi:hypothetical protein
VTTETAALDNINRLSLDIAGNGRRGGKNTNDHRTSEGSRSLGTHLIYLVSYPTQAEIGKERQLSDDFARGFAYNAYNAHN